MDMYTDAFYRLHWSQSCSSFGDGGAGLPEPCDSMMHKLDKSHLLASRALSGFIKHSSNHDSGCCVRHWQAFVPDSYHERERIISVMESKCEMTDPNPKVICWCINTGCAHSIGMYKWVKKKRLDRCRVTPLSQLKLTNKTSLSYSNTKHCP